MCVSLTVVILTQHRLAPAAITAFRAMHVARKQYHYISGWQSGSGVLVP